LSGNFNHPINNLLIGLKILRLLRYSFIHSINALPNTIETLQLNPRRKLSIYKLPSNLKLFMFDEIDLEQIKK